MFSPPRATAPAAATSPGDAAAAAARGTHRLAALAASVAGALPRGRTLPDRVWVRRHRALLVLLWAHGVGLTVFAFLMGESTGHALSHGGVVTTIAALAVLAHRRRRLAAAFVSIGLISSSALLVHTWGGVIEGHFHFFVMIALLALYEDWLPFLLAAAYVVLHHGLAGALEPAAVYNHADAVRHPWKWALIHGGFVAGAATASVVTWRLNENVRAETEEAYRRASESEERFKSAFDQAPVGMVLASIDPADPGRFLQVNRAMCELTGYAEDQLVGMHFSDLTHPDDLEESWEMGDKLRAGEASSYELTKRYIHASGRTLWVKLHVSLLSGVGGQPRCTIGQIVDITEPRAAEEALRRNRRQLAEAQKLAQLGSWEWNPVEDESTCSEELYRIFGWTEGVDEPRLGQFIELVHPEDRARVSQVVEDAVANASPFRFEARLARSDGETRIIESYGEVVDVTDGRVTKMVGTVQDLTERRQVELELARRQQAEREHKARSEFLSRISHELRTPLNAILGFTQLLEMDDPSDNQRENIELIEKGGHHLLNLINEVLEISRIEAGNLTVSVEPVHVRDAVSEVLDLLRPLAAEHGVFLQSRIFDDDSSHVAADHQRLKQVLLNLVSNGIKYNRAGGTVEIALDRPDPGRVLIRVADTGRGIAESKLASVFSPFDRLGAEQTTIEGTGLGLTLSKHLVEAMGGTLEVASEAGVGSTFTVALPGAESSRVPAPGDGVAGGHAPVAEAGATLLYVEDNLSNFKLVEQALRRRGPVRLLTAMEGSLGLELARQHRPDLVLLDLHLPGMDGEEMLQRLKRDPATAAIPVLAVSADATSSRIQRVLAAGAVGFVTKPLDLEHFLGLVEETLRERAGV